MFTKFGESTNLKIEDAATVSPLINDNILDEFKKTAKALKILSPASEDFLYFSTIVMHAAEASAINDDGTPKMKKNGEPVAVGWDVDAKGSWKWKTNDDGVKPYRNANLDIFPELELIKAHKKWIGKPLCIDHKSSSVDFVRGYIVDTYYDRNLKRIVALCALDKKNYPDLAHKVSSGITPNVSMGTGVGVAICSDCGTVAKAEKDFCNHMRTKTCYGEINIDLNPIELSIVVNPADQKAQIKHIIAAANALNSYVEEKQNQLDKLAEKRYTANISFSDYDTPRDDYSNGGSASFTINGNSFEEFKKDLEKAIKRLEQIAEQKTKLENTSLEMDKNESDSETDFNLQSPSQKLAEDEVSNLKKVFSALENKLENLVKNFEKLSNGDNMSEMNKKGYYQGTVEPTPGKPQYNKDPLNEHDREKEDKHMLVDDLGGTEGMHPGVKSVGMSELERKKMLARAEADERAMKRASYVEKAQEAIGKKEGYFQGGGGVNEPAPGKVKYPADKMNMDLRDEDKHMVGQKPFPGVGDVNKLHPSPNSADVSDELKRKQMLHRAGLEGKFVKVANPDGSVNFDKTSWEIYNDGNLILRASVKELSGDRGELFYDSIATKEFGKTLLSQVKVQGINKVAQMYKLAQAAPAPVQEQPAQTADMGQMQEMPAAPAAPAAPAPEAEAQPEDMTDSKETALDKAEKVRDLSSDLVESLKGLEGQKSEMGAIEETLGAQASFTLKSLNSMREQLSEELSDAIKQCVAELNDHEKELKMIAKLCDQKIHKKASKDFVDPIFEAAFEEADVAIANSYALMEAFVKYARGTEAIMKRIAMEDEMSKMDSDKDSDETESAIQEVLDELNAEKESEEMDADDHCASDEDDDMNNAEMKVNKDELKNLELKPGDKVTVASASFATKEGRTALRAKLAADTLKVSPLLHEAHPKGGTETDLDVPVADDLALVEDLEEVHKAVEEVAKASPKVRKDAEMINTLISQGSITEEDLDGLVAEGVDKAAVEYYKKYYGEAGKEGKEFADALLREQKKSASVDELAKEKVKLASAYDLAYEMAAKQLIADSKTAISEKVDEIMKFNDDNFMTLKRIVADYKPVTNVKTASFKVPSVGFTDSNENYTPQSDDLTTQLTFALSNPSRRLF
ncbi:MAG: hypothetical protein LC122_12950 [Chitinophagales bacterium]|nr:hypothetical protein [Chitinophagales bacterium]